MTDFTHLNIYAIKYYGYEADNLPEAYLAAKLGAAVLICMCEKQVAKQGSCHLQMFTAVTVKMLYLSSPSLQIDCFVISLGVLFLSRSRPTVIPSEQKRGSQEVMVFISLRSGVKLSRC